MKTLHAVLEANPILRAALAVPVVIMFLFSFFNLSAPLDQQRALEVLNVGIVNADEGMGPMRLTDRLLEGLGGAMPFTLVPQADAAAGQLALEAGQVSALISFPADFSRSALGEGPVRVEVMGTQHLSIAESQLGAMLPQQLQAGMTAALGQAMAAAGRTPPQVVVEGTMLHAASGQATLMAPVVAVFALWVAGLAGAALLHFGTRPLIVRQGALQVAVWRSAAPLLVSGMASLLLSFTIAWLVGNWGAFLLLWIVSWLSAYAITVLLGGLLALLSGWALLAAIPLVFYQAVLSGTQAPVDAAPDWLAWLGALLPFEALPRALRSVLIGGPDGGIALVAVSTAIIGVALIFAGTYLWAGRSSTLSPELHA